jgi:hypothetical protein
MASTTDYVEVKLTERGADLAGPGGSCRVVGSTYDLAVSAGKTSRVTRGEWTEILSKRCDSEGAPLFELARPTAPISSGKEK